jgi:hypothetical protein
VEATGRFDLRERISGGVTAEVYRAYDREQDRDVVIRILRDGLDSEYVERFQRAAEDAADVRHANVVAVLAHGELDGRPFAARELVEGSTLDDLLARRGPLPEEEARGLAAQIATGLSAAHARGLLHRDLSAGSVIVAADGTAKVADFAMPGVSRHPAPEQIAGRLIDERTDVYGLGAVLYQMLTGHVPRGRPVSPRRLVPRISKRVEAVAMRALEPDPARRYPTAAAMADALRSATPPIRRGRACRCARACCGAGRGSRASARPSEGRSAGASTPIVGAAIRFARASPRRARRRWLAAHSYTTLKDCGALGDDNSTSSYRHGGRITDRCSHGLAGANVAAAGGDHAGADPGADARADGGTDSRASACAAGSRRAHDAEHSRAPDDTERSGRDRVVVLRSREPKAIR